MSLRIAFPGWWANPGHEGNQRISRLSSGYLQRLGGAMNL
jgi:hypothetical protein